MGVTTVLFDVGGVVVYTPFELAARLEERQGLEPGTLGLAGPFAPGGDPAWEQVLAGTATEDAYWRRHAERLRPVLGLEGENPTTGLMAALFTGAEDAVVRPGIHPTLDALQARGLVTAVLSNHLALYHHPETMDGVLSRFDPIVDLSYSDVRKPAPEAFTEAVEVLGGPDPATVLHVDDLPVHVAGAEAAGLQGFRFDPLDPSGSFARLVEVAAR